MIWQAAISPSDATNCDGVVQYLIAVVRARPNLLSFCWRVDLMSQLWPLSTGPVRRSPADDTNA